MKKFLFIFICMFMFIGGASAEVNHFYAKADDSVNFDKNVNASAAIAGEDVKLNGNVDGVLFSAGSKVELNGNVSYGVLAGEKVIINGNILKDSVIAGASVEIKNANLKRDALIVAEEINSSGKIEGNATLTANKITLENIEVLGNLKVYSNEIIIGENVTIKGTLSYPEDANIDINSSALIGKTVKTDSLSEENNIENIQSEIISLLSLLLIFLVLSLLLPKVFVKISEKYKEFNFEKGIETFTKGLVFLIGIPIICIILLCISFAIPLALIIVGLYAIAIYLSKILVAYLIGDKICNKWLPNSSVLVKGLIGILIVFVILLIPILNTICSCLFILIGLGMIFDLRK